MGGGEALAGLPEGALQTVVPSSEAEPCRRFKRSNAYTIHDEIPGSNTVHMNHLHQPKVLNLESMCDAIMQICKYVTCTNNHPGHS